MMYALHIQRRIALMVVMSLLISLALPLANIRLQRAEAAGPGNISTGLQLWFKANAGVTGTTNVTAWADQSTNTWSADQQNGAGSSPVTPSLTSDAINFNPAITFFDPSSDDYSFFKIDDPTPQTYWDADFTSIVVYQSTQADTGPFHWQSPALLSTEKGGAFADYALGLEGGNLALKIESDGNNFTTQTAGTYIDDEPRIVSNTRNLSVDYFLYANSEQLLTGVDAGDALGEAGDKDGVTIGNHTGNTSQDGVQQAQFDGEIAEVIHFDRELTDPELQQVESYLALKYGITLYQGGLGRDYLASDGIIEMWDKDATDASTYNNDIAGIGQDDDASLLQPQSRSENDDSIVTIGGATGLSNLEFMTWANDNAAMAWSTGDTPEFQRLTREWLVHENNGDVGTTTIQVADADLPAGPTGQVYMYADDDGVFAAGSTEVIMTNNAGIWEANYNFSDGEYFTFARNAVPTDITSDGSNTDNIDEGSAINALIGTLGSTDADSGDTHSYAFVSGTGDEDNGQFTLTGASNQELRLNFVPDFEAPADANTDGIYNIRLRTTDSSGDTFEDTITVTINDVNAAPTDISIDSLDIAENQPIGSFIGNFSSVDDGEQGTITYSLVAGAGDDDNSLFAVSGTTLVTNSAFDFETKSSFTIRAQVFDGAQTYSEQFTITITDIANETDGDGADDGVEDMAPNGGDGNNDGLADSVQSEVSSIVSSVSGEYNTLAIANDCSQITSFSAVAESALDTQDELDYPVGLWDLSLTCPTNGDTVDILIYLDKEYDTSNWVFKKYNSLRQEYTNIADQVSYGTATIGSRLVTTLSYSVTDGGPLDEDGVANGTIIDPAGPGIEAAELAETGAETISISIVGATILMLGLLNVVHMIRTRRGQLTPAAFGALPTDLPQGFTFEDFREVAEPAPITEARKIQVKHVTTIEVKEL